MYTVREVDAAAVRPFWPSSFGRPYHDLLSSIKTLGLIRPLIVMADGAAFKLISGNLRLAAFIELGRPVVPVFVLPPETSLAEGLEIALAENRERGWNPAETALVWKFLCDNLPEDKALKLGCYLDLDKSPKIRGWALAAAALPENGLKALADGGLDLESAARLAVWDEESLAAILDIFEALGPSKQKKRQWQDWLEDISRREKTTPAGILKSPEVAEALALADRHGRPAAESAARQYLWARRHPLLAELTERRQSQIKSLALPVGLKLEADSTFEDLKFSLNLTFTSHDELKKLAEKVSELADNPALAAMLNEGTE